MNIIKIHLSGIISKTVLTFFLTISLSTIYSQTWSSFAGGGMNDWVYSSTVYNGDLIVGGKFTSAGGVSANYIARWDGTSWHALGTGVNGKVNALTVYNGNLIAAGEFTIAGGLEVNFIAQWDGIAWNDELGGVGSTVTSLAVMGDTLYAGGYFVEADNTPVNFIAKRDTAGWVSLGSGMGGSQGQVMALTVHNGELYAGGFFTTAGGISANHIAKWNGISWSALGTGIDNIVYTLSEYNGDLIAGGLFLSAGGVPANNIASWNGTAWSALGGGMGGTFYQYVFALAVYNGHLVAGGYFTTSEGLPTNGIAQWDGTAWTGMGGGFFYPANVYGAHTLCNYGNDLVAGGLFTSAGGTSASHIASWNEPMLPATLDVQNETITEGAMNCYNATQTITVAGGGTTFLVQFGGSATMIAGQNILFLPGTVVQPGGYLAAYITTTGQYCGALKSQTVITENGGTRPGQFAGGELLNVYPNPTRDLLTIAPGNNPANAKADIFNAQGRRITAPIAFSGKAETQVSLAGHPAGIYYIRLTSSNSTGTRKIIKTE